MTEYLLSQHSAGIYLTEKENNNYIRMVNFLQQAASYRREKEFPKAALQ